MAHNKIGAQMTKELITIAEFISKFSISRTSLYREVLEGRLRLLKRGRRSLIERSDAEQWVQSLKDASQKSRTQQSA